LSDLTPFQPVGPFFHVMLRDEPRGHACLVSAAAAGQRVTLQGSVLDGAGMPVTDALVEIWQADASGRYRHPEDPGSAMADPGCAGYGRTATDALGRFRFDTVKPGAVAGPSGRPQAPHIVAAVMAPGILTRYWTRVYFDDEPSNASDHVLQIVPPERRHTLIAATSAPGRYTFDIRLQGEGETVFFDA
jgi:protocatechuate 3,4-dioxygenase alpha subunit